LAHSNNSRPSTHDQHTKPRSGDKHSSKYTPRSGGAVEERVEIGSKWRFFEARLVFKSGLFFEGGKHGGEPAGADDDGAKIVLA
jgi:outer membrane receptor for monomeric catechols